MSNNIKIQGFVFMNLNTDENSFMKKRLDAFYGKEESQNPPSTNSSVNQRMASTEILETSLKSLFPLSVEEFAAKINLTEDKLISIHIQGSRFYETDVNSSDWDIMIIAAIDSTFEFKEFMYAGEEYDVRIFSPQAFLEKLASHDLAGLEFIYHPDSVKLLETGVYEQKINPSRLINWTITDIDRLWKNAKIEIEGGDAYKGLKNIFHSFRYLFYAKQILTEGKITDYKAANYLYDSIVNNQEYKGDFKYFEENYWPLVEQMQQELIALDPYFIRAE